MNGQPGRTWIGPLEQKPLFICVSPLWLKEDGPKQGTPLYRIQYPKEGIWKKVVNIQESVV